MGAVASVERVPASLLPRRPCRTPFVFGCARLEGLRAAERKQGIGSSISERSYPVKPAFSVPVPHRGLLLFMNR
jgi:hypothetical protein